MEKFVIYTLTAVFVVAVVLAILFGFWHLWTWVLPQIWPTGPATFINPSFWLFTAVWFLASWIGNTIFGRSTS